MNRLVDWLESLAMITSFPGSLMQGFWSPRLDRLTALAARSGNFANSINEL